MSSGSLTADRRFAYARSLKGEGDVTAAAEVMAQALEEAPGWAEGRFALAEMLEESGDAAAATHAYRAYLEVEPADSMGAGARLALLGAAATPDALPGAYVRRLFDQYAEQFDTALVQTLGYRAPALLRAAIGKTAPERRFARAYDLGCGTGLAGTALRDLADWLGGVDLSPAMIRAAAQKGVYDTLEADDMVQALARLSAPCDLMVAADVLVYCGDLAPLFAAVAAHLTGDGLFAFTVQRADGEAFVLGPEQRFNHSRVYIARAAGAAGFGVAVLEDVVTRREKGEDVPGLLAILNRAPG